MASSGKKKTTMAKLARETRLRERRLNKQAKKEARKHAPPEHLDSSDDALSAAADEGAQPAPEQTAPGVGEADSAVKADASAADNSGAAALGE